MGNKKDKTDIHSAAAQSCGMSRDDTKTLNYGVIYGLGLGGAIRHIQRCSRELTLAECRAKAESYMASMKGVRSGNTRRWQGGIGSYSFNVMEELANSRLPRTPLLKACLTKSLAGVKDFATTRVNWTIQSSGVDFRDCLIVFTKYFFELLGVEGRLLMTIHDEIRLLVKEGHETLAVYALQLAHFYIRAYFIQQLGLDCIPAGIAWFSGVDIDTVLRKEPTDPGVTPTQTEPIPSGQCWSPEDLLEKLQDVNLPW